jgi:hypothetical protein
MVAITINWTWYSQKIPVMHLNTFFVFYIMKCYIQYSRFQNTILEYICDQLWCKSMKGHKSRITVTSSFKWNIYVSAGKYGDGESGGFVTPPPPLSTPGFWRYLKTTWTVFHAPRILVLGANLRLARLHRYISVNGVMDCDLHKSSVTLARYALALHASFIYVRFKLHLHQGSTILTFAESSK